ncbi:MAG: Spy/CpxP family protein refolding chaperone [Phycisphaerae bacterium]|nr:Spy/CpxP family protein refolding chaperone [Phycisphaerae bacterium]
MKRKLLVITALVALGPLAAWAEPAETKPAEGRRGWRRGEKTRLNLSEEQRDKFKALREEFRPKFQEARKSGDKEKIKAVHEEFLTKAKTFLTSEQVEKMQARGKAMHKRWNHRRQKMGPKLDLSDEQKAKMKDLREKHRLETQALRDKHKTEMKEVLTPEQVEKLEAWRKDKPKHFGRHGPRGRRGWGGPRGKHGRGHKGPGPCDEDAPGPVEEQQE